MIASGSSDLELAAQICGTTSPHIDSKEIAEILEPRISQENYTVGRKYSII